MIWLSIGPPRPVAQVRGRISLRLLLKKSDELLHCVQPDCQTTAQTIQRIRIASQGSMVAGLEKPPEPFSAQFHFEPWLTQPHAYRSRGALPLRKRFGGKPVLGSGSPGHLRSLFATVSRLPFGGHVYRRIISLSNPLGVGKRLQLSSLRSSRFAAFRFRLRATRSEYQRRGWGARENRALGVILSSAG